MLAVVHLRPRGAIGERVGPSAEERLLFEKEHGNGTAGEGDRGSESAQATADDDRGVHRVCGRAWTVRRRANQEYFNWWLSQYRKAISTFRIPEMEILRSKTLYPADSMRCRVCA